MALELPAGLTVDRDESAEKALYDQARTWLDGHERAEGMHASDLLMPRKGFWRVVDPQPITEREIGLFLVGKVLHAFILAQDPASKGRVDLLTTDEGQLYDEELEIWYSPDKLIGNVPFEFKTSRGLYMPRNASDLETYLKQLLIYMGTRKSPKGLLGVFYINAKDDANKTTPQFRVFEVNVPPEAITAVRLQIRAARDELAQALAVKKHGNLALCPEWACHPEQCGWWVKCKPEGRYENLAYIKGKRR